MLVGYSILYLVLSFRSKLEWSVCGPWASPSNYSSSDMFISWISSSFLLWRLYSWFYFICDALQLREYIQGSKWPMLYVDQSRSHSDRLVEYRKSITISQTCPAIRWLFLVILTFDDWSLISFSLLSKQILNKSEGMGVITTMEWPLVLSLLGAWVLVFICLCRGIKQSGKVSVNEQSLLVLSSFFTL